MKLLIASDIHGSAYYCRKFLNRIAVEAPDKVLLLGDLLYHGPRNDLPRDYAPKEVIKMLESVSDMLLCVRGNCDAEVDQAVLHFPILAEYALIATENYTVYAVHGHHDMTNLPVKEGCIVASGHTHLPKFTRENGVLFINPGSVSIPRDDTPHGYVLIDGDKLYHKDLDGTVIREMTVG